MERYKTIFEDESIEESFVAGSKRPDNEGGKYIITKTTGRDPKNPKRFVPGWKKVKKAGSALSKKSGLTKSAAKKRAKKAALTRKRDKTGTKKAIKKRKQTLKKNKRK